MARKARPGVIDARFEHGLLNLAEAGRYLDVPQRTFHRWARGYERGEPLLHVLPADRGPLPVTFIALAEAHVLDALRDAGVRPHKIRPALAALQSEFGRDYVLVAPELATDGIDVLWDFAMSEPGQGLIAGDTGQHVIREIVEDQMSYIAWDDRGYPTELQLRQWLPAKVIVNVHRSFGQPVFAGSGARVSDVASMTKAGENAETVADEFGISISDVRAAARILLGRAA
ncbi:DUF433 domain-containing protein [Dactylosporangium sucinum]|uniref:Putative antitoxin VapB45-like DNA-binding HTH domain-containing protein n=1 Tax=Dactylosporangium sucinum TaxID=1424081 RepID=A0A917U8X2_9ACTN|nr:DUF433 domain-containing protein [Dactylosporangium sucinum]GGM66161.1 hypothetical protein GCM10007977_079660 [Dactylosporangium sucinum]